MPRHVALRRASSLALAAAVAASTASRVFTTPPADESARLHRVVQLRPGSAVSVRATTGSVTIAGWDRSDLEVDIVRRAPTATELEEVPAIVEEAGNRLTIAALQRSDPRNPRLTAAIRINAPRTARFETVHLVSGPVAISRLEGFVDAKSQSGELTASELSGTIRLETMIGRLSLDGARLSVGGLIRLRAFFGDVKLRLDPLPTDARILATTFNGRISSDIPLNTKDGFGVRFGEATLGRGEPMINIDVITGNIDIASRARD